MLYALLDGEKAIDRPHVEAALALWTYCEQSARDVLGETLSAGPPPTRSSPRSETVDG